MDDSGFPRTPDRPVKLLETCVHYLRSVETSIGARGPDFLGGSATIYTWLISMLVKLNYLHAYSLSLAWVGYGIEGFVMLE